MVHSLRAVFIEIVLDLGDRHSEKGLGELGNKTASLTLMQNES